MSHLEIKLSDIDEERFGVRTARGTVFTNEDVQAVWDFCSHNQVVMLIVRCLVTDIFTAQAVERKGGLLMDTLVYYARDLTKGNPAGEPDNVIIRPLQVGEEKQVENVARKAFQGFYGHYHADARLPREKCDEVYTSWAYRSCISREFAHEVLVAELDGNSVGFITLRKNNPEEGEIVLNAVLPGMQKQGIYRSLVIKSLDWFRLAGMKQVIVSTQLVNIAPQKVWSRLGFEPCYSYYTFHKWFDSLENNG